ncbi:MAG: hypothetical protein M3Z05_06150 [Gemmatimonadota bacterium]|nr:hypothetical protein [Gemmatimonadota bacterium]
MAPASLRALLAGLIDYAGLFPPAALPLEEVVRNYGAYRHSPESWALGRLVVPAVRLLELLDLLPIGEPPWSVTALVGEDVIADARRIASVRGDPRVSVEAAEARAFTDDEIGAATRALSDVPAVYIELPAYDDPSDLVRAVGEAGARAKIRTGGMTVEVFPSAAECARFIAACAHHRVAFKATAGLHHPIRGAFPLTYADDAPRGVMFGFLNVFFAGALARGGMEAPALEQVLMEREVARFDFHDAGAAWRGHTLSLEDIADARDAFAISFGSCSFREPINDLTQLGLL